ncbi:MAG: hypothetical protein KJ604_20165, partial [Gammaproteobacteria bacterium]|nr:hypothetical protein [Gammaproteobacteria bacterium]
MTVSKQDIQDWLQKLLNEAVEEELSGFRVWKDTIELTDEAQAKAPDTTLYGQVTVEEMLKFVKELKLLAGALQKETGAGVPDECRLAHMTLLMGLAAVTGNPDYLVEPRPEDAQYWLPMCKLHELAHEMFRIAWLVGFLAGMTGSEEEDDDYDIF